MFLENVEVCEDELDDLVGSRDEGVEEAVDAGRVGARVVGAAERAALLAIRRRVADT